ncbi:manganese efflux pump MntP [Clostridium weizhouense]|uniref:Manganese efflux pump MntP family protein n=1 Tax=Clostridium weizhouense TaxID=2859781 RepID=A0ABS7AKK6_9CLOT|nr:manganese efflux pump [Clostridium weizhouense]MBW6408628.1 manganese efflux pump MntP family protein [Clostridium weizhouense]
MNVSGAILIGTALAMDALGVTLGIGVNPLLKKINKIKFILSFTIFQFLFTYIGGILGYLFDTYVATISSIAGGIIMGIIGLLMIIDGLKNEDSILLIKNSTCIILGISVSIDALVIGFTNFHHLGTNTLLFLYALLMGLIAMFICTIGFWACRYIKRIRFINRYANFLGGIFLILFGAKIIFF